MFWCLIISAIIFLCGCDQLSRGRKLFLAILCIAFSVIVGMRTNDWNDTPEYWYAFSHFTKPIYQFWETRQNHFFEDKGFLLINSIIYSVTNSRFIFFTIIAGLTNWFLYKNLLNYSVFPITGFIFYIGRFGLSRNFMQIRAALAIMMVIYAIQYVSKKDWKRFFIWVGIASSIHYTMLLSIPIYWMDRLKLTQKKIITISVLSLLITYIFAPYIFKYVSSLSLEYQIALTYTMESSEYTVGKGLANPMIYFQLILLWIFSISQIKLASQTPYYYTIRNAYFYSTILLIVFSSFGVLSARSSTIFATVEIFILPALCKLVSRKYQFFATILVALLGLSFFFIKYSDFINSHPSFNNPLL
ncbi:MAG: EpsG family protein [Muribaculaceae bacterium]|nr:EpsG family protein [Muribaculaceae bacterium]